MTTALVENSMTRVTRFDPKEVIAFSVNEAEIAKVREARAEALRPDRDKLWAVATAVGRIEIPEVSDEAEAAAEEIRERIVACGIEIQKIVKKHFER